MADARLVKKGRGEPLDGLLQQGRASLALAETHAGALAQSGWPPASTAAMESTLAKLESDTTSVLGERAASRGATTSEYAALNEGKAFVRKLRLALPKVLRGAPADVDEKAFRAGEPLARSTPKLSAYLLKIRPAVLTIEQALAPFFGQQSPVAMLDAAKTALDSADSVQETTIAALPIQTAQVYEAKGHLLELIEDMNRSGKIAFNGNAVAMALFNKDILLRARSHKAIATPPVNEPVPT